jgi:hypothetical protein
VQHLRCIFRLHFVNECRLADVTGVAVALDGAPLMRLFKRKRQPETAENVAAATRLQTVTDRGKDETSGYPVREVPLAVPILRRLFSMPDELSPESSRA